MKLRAENLMKAYKGRKVVKDISIELTRGEIVGLLGTMEQEKPLLSI